MKSAKLNLNIKSKKYKKERMDNQGQSFETYNKIKLLGEGAFGKAFLVQCNSD